MKRKNLILLSATLVAASMMLAGCGEAASSAGAEVSVEASTEEVDVASDAEASGSEGLDSADTASSDESTEAVSGESASADDAATAISVPEFSSAEEEEQWVLEQIGGVWETNYKPANLYVFDGKEVTHYTAITEGVDWPDSYTKEKEKSEIVSFEKISEDDNEYYRIELSGYSWAVFHWTPSMPYDLTGSEPYSASSSFERPYGYSNENKITIEDYSKDFNIVE
ncbi:hypothetical protein D6856_12005 [Butyrivibrio sp. XB500-5]|uniref:hypothetical protein n=1 Tax=Butyrivibrio sp. XB500-5 TaxID=2364880 RepID=UPI000EA9DC89|nr:hypothetical protein [Butyrivibrio sp. XB500-5]RKM59094.1 hypothetical protein D6856_12005 [Butyrivibrio sp. XB500-5]